MAERKREEQIVLAALRNNTLGFGSPYFGLSEAEAKRRLEAESAAR